MQRVYLVGLVISFLVAEVSVGCSAKAPDQIDPTKKVIIRQVRVELQRKYNVLDHRGLTYHVVIKDFDPRDEYTYAIIEELKTLWQITLPETTKRNLGIDGICVCKDLAVDQVREDLVAEIKARGFTMEFTVPTTKP